MRPWGRFSIALLAFGAFGCAPLPSRALVELSDRETRFYRDLRPALLQAQDTFDVTAGALITNTAARQAAIMRREAGAARQAIYESLAAPDRPTAAVEKAIADLAAANAAVETRIEKEEAAGQQRRQAIVQIFEALGATLGAIAGNQQALDAHLKARRRLFGGPGRSAFLPFTKFSEQQAALRQAIETLGEQFKLAKELVDAAKKEFGEQRKPSQP